MISGTEDDWPAVVRNLSKVQEVLRRLTRILNREVWRRGYLDFYLNLWSSRCLFLVQKSGWSPPDGTGPGGGFQDRVAQHLIGGILRIHNDGKWEYTSAASEKEEAGFKAMEEYIRRSHNTVA